MERFEFKPVPAYRRGLMAGGRRDGVVGTMFPQPPVLVPGAPGERLLDEVLGDGFAVLGRAGWPTPLGAWRPGLPARFVAVHPSAGTPLADLPAPPAGPPATGRPDLVDVVDADGVLGGWLAAHGADLVVLRPDRFVFALVTAGGVEQAVRDLSAALGVPPDGDRTRADTSDRGGPGRRSPPS
ncbi:hypothetical protein V2I01_32150 [Micromonospora sp. BRA006-A]|nr:hypothetical protein [Micromonospora sp. BRA006-A]